MVAPRFRSGRKKKRFSAFDIVAAAGVVPLGGVTDGGENCPVRDGADRVGRARTEQIHAELFVKAPVDAGKAYLQKNLRFGGRDIDIEQIDDLARGGRDLDRAIGAGEVLHRAAQEDETVLDGDIHGLAGKLCPELAAQRLHAIVGCCRAGANGHVEKLPAASRFPNDQARLPGGFAVDQDLGWAYGRGFGEISQTDGDALNGLGDIDQHRFAHGDEKIVGGVLTGHPGDGVGGELGGRESGPGLTPRK